VVWIVFAKAPDGRLNNRRGPCQVWLATSNPLISEPSPASALAQLTPGLFLAEATNDTIRRNMAVPPPTLNPLADGRLVLHSAYINTSASA